MLSYLFYDAKSHLTNRKPSKFDKCLLVGYGAIGEAVAYELIHKGDLGLFLKDSLYIWHRDLIKRKLGEKDGFQIFNQLNNKDEFNYIIGCASRYSLAILSLSLLCNNSYLISV
ncbi:unnamed protein product [Rotaria sordida]|uniref:Uncharacterized protein n=1 Tax=Rotaria sordida TaxID=392033 RepID=A0A813XY60_9BILA|nr:unnamed protein product [Rotaria sordida]CAF0878121.1 unnamed protein product [Rotaria sordida]CAF3763584.1 unnamed protein product [Rotaria sordida]CAF3816254.1 unnamed protein product [Rotaria sordida]